MKISPHVTPSRLGILTTVIVKLYDIYQVGNQVMTKDIDFVRLNLDPLATTIQANARAWVKELGKFLNESAREDLNALKAEIEVCFKRIA